MKDLYLQEDQSFTQKLEAMKMAYQKARLSLFIVTPLRAKGQRFRLQRDTADWTTDSYNERYQEGVKLFYPVAGTCSS